MTSGTIKSEPGFSPALDSEFIGTGNDYIRNDVDGKHMRLDAHGVVKYVNGWISRSCGQGCMTMLKVLNSGLGRRMMRYVPISLLLVIDWESTRCYLD